MMRVPIRVAVFLVLLISLGCTHPISKGMRETLDPQISPSSLFASPDVYIGKKILLGGTIVETRNFPDKSEIEVVQKAIDSYGNVSSNDATAGRFIIRKQGYLESEVYSKGREIIGAGRVAGSQLGKIGDREYRFPVIEAGELHLKESYTQYPYYYDPFYPFYYDPFYHPFHHRHFRHRHFH